MRQLLSGNEAVARGAYEAGCLVGTAYPGTPSTEILASLAQYGGIYCEWSVNEKVALEVAFGASIGGCRAITAMKHVGLNVAADPMFSAAYEGVNGGFVIVTADDPGAHSSQNEQDNRRYAVHAKLLMLEPSDSRECLEYARAAFELSERFDIPVLLRMTTRVCHGRGPVEPGEPLTPHVRDYVKDVSKYVPVPENALRLHIRLEEKLRKIAEYAETSLLNRIEWGSREAGVIAGGISYQYAREALGDGASYLKLGLTHPLPAGLIRSFASSVKKLYIVEENDPYLEDAVKALGIACVGKDLLPRCGELNAGIVERALKTGAVRPYETVEMPLPARMPALCPGCPHRGVFYALGKFEDVMLANDIGCYTLGMSLPASVTDTCVCMGGGVTVALGFEKACAASGRRTRAVGVVGDSTFFHSGITGLINAVYNGSAMTLIILDNRVTAMTGLQGNPGTGRDIHGNPAKEVSIEAIVRACGVDGGHLRVVDPLNLQQTEEALRAGLVSPGLFVVIASAPCVLKQDRQDRRTAPYAVDAALCTGCAACADIGCPSIILREGKAAIDAMSCSGCALCAQVCPPEAIQKAGEGQ